MNAEEVLAGTYLFRDLPPDRVKAAYGPNLARLIEVKRRWDPDNVFRGSLNITPR